MKGGTLFAIVALAAYLGFEGYAIRAASERTEPAYIHNMLVVAQTTTELCQSEALEMRPRFNATLEKVTASYREDLAAANPELASEQLDDLLEELTSAASRAAADAVNTDGCSTEEARANFQRYRIYARRSR